MNLGRISQIKSQKGVYDHVLGILDRYCVTQAIVKVQFIGSIKVNAIYKSRKSDHIPELIMEQLKRIQKKTVQIIYWKVHTITLFKDRIFAEE